MSDRLEGHRARKRFGQNFLHDVHWIDRIIEAINPVAGEELIEIGPGQAALTRRVIALAGRESAVEIDRDLAQWLRSQFTEESLRLIEADALTLDWPAIFPGKRLRIFGNLPYNISSPLLFALIPAAPRVVDQHFMLQKEVVDRMVSPPGSKVYGRLSAMLQRHYRLYRLFDVPPGAFQPAPKVTSSVVRMIPIPAEEKVALDEKLYAQVVAAAFSMRRKTLKNALAAVLDASEIQAAGVRPESRAETLSVKDFERLTAILAAKPSSSAAES